MPHPSIAQVAKPFVIIYGLLFLGLSYFAIYPAWSQREPMTLVVMLTWMFILAGIVATYTVAVVFLAGDDEA